MPRKKLEGVGYSEYKKICEETSFELKKYSKFKEQLKGVRAKYQQYLKKNPFKKERAELQKKVDKQLKKVLESIPDWGKPL